MALSFVLPVPTDYCAQVAIEHGRYVMVKIRLIFYFIFIWASLSVAGCQPVAQVTQSSREISDATSAESQSQTATSTPSSPTATQTPDQSRSEPTQTPQPVVIKETSTQMPTSKEAENCILLYYEEYAQVELVSSQDVRVLIDIQDPEKLSHPPTENDVLLTTHAHFDHVNDAFLASFPGRQLFVRSGTLSLPGVEITSIPSAHNAGDRPREEGGTNYIYLVEMGSLRIAHFGDIGQQALTQEQLDLLGEVDIAITQFANPYSEMNIQNRKGFNLMEQVQPKLIIPTHLNLETATAMGQWERMEPIQLMYTDQPYVSICPGEFTVRTQQEGNRVIVLMGENARQFAERLDLVKYGSQP